MTREEQILSAAREYNSGVIFSSPSNVLHFEAGAHWADEHPINVWHTAEEEPEKEKLLVITDGCDLEVKYWPFFDLDWKTYVDWYFVKKWTYLSDPDDEE